MKTENSDGKEKNAGPFIFHAYSIYKRDRQTGTNQYATRLLMLQQTPCTNPIQPYQAL